MNQEEKRLSVLIGNFVSRNRLNLGLSQDILAEKANIDNSTLSQIENGKRIPKLETFFKIVETLKYFSSKKSNEKKFHFEKDLKENFEEVVQNILHVFANEEDKEK
ncbi:helix-turn-helix domain-containing protein [Athalassotoga sp.]|uniref:helix-turn-helix domain-containing protein n=1 Tax=Athalassotoga sp. TaxID=2022597 RepID=UPI003CFC80D2